MSCRCKVFVIPETWNISLSARALRSQTAMTKLAEKNMRRFGLTLIVGVAGTVTAVMSAVSQAPPALKPAFEVVSIKLNTTAEGNASVADQPGGRFVASRIPLRRVI